MVPILSIGQDNLRKFVLGTYKPTTEQYNINVRFDSTNYKIVKHNGRGPFISLTWPLSNSGNDIYLNNENRLSFSFDSLGKIIEQETDIKENIELDLNYWDKSISSSNLFSLGNLNLKKSQLNKIEWLQFSSCMGNLESIKSLKNLQFLILSNRFAMTMPRLYEKQIGVIPHYFTDHGAGVLQKGIPKGLNSLNYFELGSFNGPSEIHTFMNDNSYLLMLEGFPRNVLDLPAIKMLKIAGANYLPVNFSDFKKIEYLDIWLGYFERNTLYDQVNPELINLAIVMNSFGKDTSQGNWAHFLEYGKIDSNFDIPQNGAYRTFHRNGQPLCQGQFVNGEPDGIWKFWFSDGKLYEQREYQQGKKYGEWFMMCDSLYSVQYNKSEIDTTNVLIFQNDKLIKRIDIEYTDYASRNSQCYDYNSYKDEFSVLKHEYSLVWKDSICTSVKHTYISKRHGDFSSRFWLKDKMQDTLDGFDEQWLMNDSTWQYYCSNISNLCPDNASVAEYKAIGRIGEIAYYSCLKEKYNKQKDGKFRQILDCTTDLNSNIYTKKWFELDEKTRQYIILEDQKLDLTKILSNDSYLPNK